MDNHHTSVAEEYQSGKIIMLDRLVSEYKRQIEYAINNTRNNYSHIYDLILFFFSNK